MQIYKISIVDHRHHDSFIEKSIIINDHERLIDVRIEILKFHECERFDLRLKIFRFENKLFDERNSSLNDEKFIKVSNFRVKDTWYERSRFVKTQRFRLKSKQTFC